ncbi:hexosaminidase D [Leptinotarsa decemlineata]|uniref:hexosaminidase D n=1 Tax=Leptinotarsa decemlineata TaxID=7539 RepID=UPI003D308228
MNNFKVDRTGSQRLVHLDLKGAPPRISYFEKILPFIKNIGATGILLEWEDTFPYTKDVIPIGSLSDHAQTSGAPYSMEEAKQILTIAAACDLIVIPLLQTFGHLEFVLKHENWRSLREVEEFPSSICPSKSGTIQLITSLLEQMIEFHPSIQYIHLGGDEVWHMGMCSICEKRIQTSQFGKSRLYLDHMSKIGHYVKENYPGLKIIVWDDMFRNIEVEILQEYPSCNFFELMIWNYLPSDSFHLNDGLWEKYNSVFSNLWIASAFKGATSSCQLIPVIKYHLSNHLAWLTELEKNSKKIGNLRGIALTGWSRFDHFATFCELLPCGIPSLCFCMATWISGGYSQDLEESVRKLLGSDCGTISYLESSTVCLPKTNPQPTFPGWQIFVGIEMLMNLRTRYKNLINSDQLQTWFNTWQVLNSFTNPMQIKSLLLVVIELLGEMSTVKEHLKKYMEEVFFNHTLEEFFGTLMVPVEHHLNQMKTDIERQLSLGGRAREHMNL